MLLYLHWLGRGCSVHVKERCPAAEWRPLLCGCFVRDPGASCPIPLPGHPHSQGSLASSWRPAHTPCLLPSEPHLGPCSWVQSGWRNGVLSLSVCELLCVCVFILTFFNFLKYWLTKLSGSNCIAKPVNSVVEKNGGLGGGLGSSQDHSFPA